MLTVRRLNQYYDDSHTLRDVDLEVKPGRVLCLLGRNGVGKTTLLDTIVGLLPARSGSVTLANGDLTGLPAEHRVRRGIGYVPQGRMIFPDLSVRENLLLACAARRDGTRTIPKAVFDFFPVLAEMAGRRGGDLSGGQQQQLAIGRALVLEPRVLLLDEPCEGIQPNIVQLIGRVLTRLRDESDTGILLVEQKLPFARAVADDFAIMDRGTLVAEGPIGNLTPQLVDAYLAV
jgi:urea transport system ATP-binding protein